MQLDPIFLDTYIKAVQAYSYNYTDGVFACDDLPCNICPLLKNTRCYIALERDRLTTGISSSSFEQTYVAPILLQTHPELFI